ncbi:hypothetical protein Ocin01_10529 [Orchesella cincta]|uniref:Uncharacterized protein n=1 Tax=Orchesella cincta TaxID=48709 RepID=A0A1D2MT19_ORCCI|nr:hypothetical protein Ocin01_10529 [Orchesella cincta]
MNDVDGGGIETTGTCGKVDIRDGSYSPQGLIGPRTFVSPSGKMRVLFYHGFIWGLVRNFNFDLLDPSLNPMLRVEIAFTAIKDCPSTNTTLSGETQNESDPNFNSLISCSPSAVNNSKTCISKELRCDRTLNCGFEQDFGSDEDILGCHELLNIVFSKSQHSPPTTIASTTAGILSSNTTTSATTTTTTTSTSTEVPSSERPLSTTQNSINSNSAGDAKVPKKQSSTGTDAAGLIGLVRKFPLLIKSTTSSTTPTSQDYADSKDFESPSESPPPSNFSTTPKMPFASGGELFADIKPDPVEDSLIDGASKEEIVESDSMSLNTIAGIVSVVAVVLILSGILRVWYCYNKVIWNPHGSLPSSGTPPEFPNPGLMRKIKQLVAESEEGFPEKKCMGLKEQPPSYEILFPLPEEKVENKSLNV